MTLSLPSRLLNKKVPCPYCDGDHKRWDFNAGGPGIPGYVHCVCKDIAEREAFMDQLPPTNLAHYTSAKFEAKNPLEKSLFIVGPEDNVWALLRGELEPFYKLLKVKAIVARDITAAYVNGGESPEWQALLDPHLIITTLLTISDSSRMNKIFNCLYEARRLYKKPTWFVTSSHDRYFEECYDSQTIAMLNRLERIHIFEFPATVTSATQMTVKPEASVS